MRPSMTRLWIYLRRGYSHVGFVLSFINFVVIQYRLVVEKTALAEVFPHMWQFALASVALFTPFLIMLGWLDYKRLTVPSEMALAVKSNPWSQDFIRALIHMARGENDKAVTILRRWLNDTKTKTTS